MLLGTCCVVGVHNLVRNLTAVSNRDALLACPCAHFAGLDVKKPPFLRFLLGVQNLVEP